jgi:hypothetical protein
LVGAVLEVTGQGIGGGDFGSDHEPLFPQRERGC